MICKGIMGVLGFQFMHFGHIFGDSVYFWLVMAKEKNVKVAG